MNKPILVGVTGVGGAAAVLSAALTIPALSFAGAILIIVGAIFVAGMKWQAGMGADQRRWILILCLICPIILLASFIVALADGQPQRWVGCGLFLFSAGLLVVSSSIISMRSQGGGS
jgi:hypothetical protein